MTCRRSALTTLVALTALLAGCETFESRSSSPTPTPTYSPNLQSAPYQGGTAVAPEASELDACMDLDAVHVRFGPPGFINSTTVGLFVELRGIPAGDNAVRLHWDWDNHPELFEDIPIGSASTFDEVIEHTYLDANVGDHRKVRMEVMLNGEAGHCARNRHVILQSTGPVTSGPNLPQSGVVTLCDLGWGTAVNEGICGIPSDPNTSYWYNFENAQKVPAGDPTADISKGHVDCCSWNVQNGATQVDTGIPVANVGTVQCGPSDGRTYTSGPIPHFQPNSTVICLRTAGGRYVKYTARYSCCGDNTIDWSAF